MVGTLLALMATFAFANPSPPTNGGNGAGSSDRSTVHRSGPFDSAPQRSQKYRTATTRVSAPSPTAVTAARRYGRAVRATGRFLISDAVADVVRRVRVAGAAREPRVQRLR